MSSDLETQPLLGAQPHCAEPAVLNTTKKHGRWGAAVKWSTIFGIASIFAGLLIFGTLFVRNLPSQDVIEKSVIQITNWEIVKLHLDGWTNGNRLDNDSGKALQVSTTINVWLDYDQWLASNQTALDLRQKRLYRSISENIVRTACFDLNNVTTYDGENIDSNIVGLLQVKEPLCVDLHNNRTTQLNLTLFVEPRMDKVLRVLKKIWHHEYDKLALSSIIDVTLSKKTSRLSNRWNLRLARLRGLRIDWKDIIKWETISFRLKNLRHQFDQIKVQSFAITDSIKGFNFNIEAEPIDVSKFLGWLEFPTNSVMPFINWEIRLPDCYEEYTIDLPTVCCFTDSFIVREEINVTAYSNIEGPLPESLLSQVCWSDEENAFTPMTNLFNKIFNETELLTMEVRGHAINSSNEDSNLFVPYEILEPVLQGLSFFPISSNITIDSDSLIKDVTIEGLRIKWVSGLFGQKRLSVVGKIVGTIALPFYETSKERLSVEYLKGVTMLYHNSVHFLTIPMRVWSKASSRISHYGENKTTMMELSLNIQDNEVQVTNSVELTKIFNEILLKRDVTVDLESNMDVLISTPLGNMVLMGLKGKGSAVMRP